MLNECQLPDGIADKVGDACGYDMNTLFSLLQEAEFMTELFPVIGDRRRFHAYVMEKARAKPDELTPPRFEFSVSLDPTAIATFMLIGSQKSTTKIAQMTLMHYSKAEDERDHEGRPLVPRESVVSSIDMHGVRVRHTNVSNYGLHVTFAADSAVFSVRDWPEKEVFSCRMNTENGTGGPAEDVTEFPRGLDFPEPASKESIMEERMRLGGCSYAMTRDRFWKHKMSYECHTCWPAGANKCICAGCVECHEGHDVVEAGRNQNMFCDCGGPAGECPVPCQAMTKGKPV